MIVQRSTAVLFAGIPVTPELYDDGEVMVAVPLVTVHNPVPEVAVLPASVKLPLAH